MKKTFSVLILLAILLMPNLVFAQTIAGILNSIMTSVVRPIAIFLVIVLWVVTGVLFLTAQGDPGKLGNAKLALIAAVGGTMIIVIAPFAAQIIGNSLGV